MKVINLFAGPGAGKSTGAAYIFSQLKMKGINCELVTEYAKDKVWEKTEKVFANQAYIFGKQFYRMSRLEDEVDVIVTDSPLLLSVQYNNNPVLGDNFNRMVKDVFSSYDNMNFFVERVKPYNPKGRFQDEEGAKKVDIELIKLLTTYSVPYARMTGNEAGYDYVVDAVLKSLGK